MSMPELPDQSAPSLAGEQVDAASPQTGDAPPAPMDAESSRAGFLAMVGGALRKFHPGHNRALQEEAEAATESAVQDAADEPSSSADDGGPASEAAQLRAEVEALRAELKAAQSQPAVAAEPESPATEPQELSAWQLKAVEAYGELLRDDSDRLDRVAGLLETRARWTAARDHYAANEDKDNVVAAERGLAHSDSELRREHDYLSSQAEIAELRRKLDESAQEAPKPFAAAEAAETVMAFAQGDGANTFGERAPRTAVMIKDEKFREVLQARLATIEASDDADFLQKAEALIMDLEPFLPVPAEPSPPALPAKNPAATRPPPASPNVTSRPPTAPMSREQSTRTFLEMMRSIH